MKACSSGYEPLVMYQILVKFQLGSTLPLAGVAEVKLASVCICAVVMPIPPADVARPEVVTSQKLPVMVTKLVPTNPPAL